MYFRSQFGKIRLFELANNNPDKKKFRGFVNGVVVQINKSKAAKNMNQSQLLAILNEPARGNGLVILAHQLIAAELNIAQGADLSDVSGDLVNAHAKK